MSRPVVVTGAGVLTAAGRGLPALASAVREGRCCLAPDDDLRALGTRCVLSGRVPGVDEAFAGLPVEGDDRAFFGRLSRLGAVAALDAVTAAAGDRPPALGRVIVATAVGPMSELLACFRDTLTGAPHPDRARAVTRVTQSLLPSWLATALGAPRGGHVVSAACVSAVEALRDALELIAAGREQAVLVGAVDEDCASTFWAFDRQRLLSPAPDVEARTRALSGRRGGFVPAGGAGFFVLEAEDVALARGCRPAVRLAAVSLRSDPRGASLVSFPAAAYRAAIDDVRGGAPFDLVLAHAPPTPADPDELAVLDEALGVVAAGTPVRSAKSLIGYALGAGAAIDVALAVHQLAEGELLPNDAAALEPAAAGFARCLQGGPTRRPLRRVLKTAYAQGRAAGAVVLEARA